MTYGPASTAPSSPFYRVTFMQTSSKRGYTQLKFKILPFSLFSTRAARNSLFRTFCLLIYSLRLLPYPSSCTPSVTSRATVSLYSFSSPSPISISTQQQSKCFERRVLICQNYSVFPLLIITALVHRSSASLIEWVVKTVAPRLEALIVQTIASREDGSNPVEHQSRRRRAGSPQRAIIMHNLRLLPPERLLNRLQVLLGSYSRFSKSHFTSRSLSLMGTSQEKIDSISSTSIPYQRASSWQQIPADCIFLCQGCLRRLYRYTSPESAVICELSSPKVVDLPAPLCPSKASLSSFRQQLTLLSACVSPKLLDTFSSLTFSLIV